MITSPSQLTERERDIIKEFTDPHYTMYSKILAYCMNTSIQEASQYLRRLWLLGVLIRFKKVGRRIYSYQLSQSTGQGIYKQLTEEK